MFISMPYSARPRKIPGWIVVICENLSVKKRAYSKKKNWKTQFVVISMAAACLTEVSVFHLRKLKMIQYDFWTGAWKQF